MENIIRNFRNRQKKTVKRMGKDIDGLKEQWKDLSDSKKSKPKIKSIGMYMLGIIGTGVVIGLLFLLFWPWMLVAPYFEKDYCHEEGDGIEFLVVEFIEFAIIGITIGICGWPFWLIYPPLLVFRLLTAGMAVLYYVAKRKQENDKQENDKK